MNYKETQAFEIFQSDGGDYVIEFRCPACQEAVTSMEFECVEGTHLGGCDHCGVSLTVTVKLVVEWEHV